MADPDFKSAHAGWANTFVFVRYHERKTG